MLVIFGHTLVKGLWWVKLCYSTWWSVHLYLNIVSTSVILSVHLQAKIIAQTPVIQTPKLDQSSSCSFLSTKHSGRRKMLMNGRRISGWSSKRWRLDTSSISKSCMLIKFLFFFKKWIRIYPFLETEKYPLEMFSIGLYSFAHDVFDFMIILCDVIYLRLRIL